MSASEVESVAALSDVAQCTYNAVEISMPEAVLEVPVTIVTTQPQSDLENINNCTTTGNTMNESESVQAQMIHDKENGAGNAAGSNSGDHHNNTIAKYDGEKTVGCDERTSSDNNSRDNITYDISHNSDNQEMSDLPTDESIAKENGDNSDIPGEADPNSSFTEESSDSLGNDCYEAEDESDARLQTISNIEDQSSDSYIGLENLESEDNSLSDEVPRNDCSRDIVHTDQSLEKVIIKENKSEDPIPTTLAKQSKDVNSPKILRKSIHDRPSFKNRMGSIRKNKKNITDFSIEIYESKRPMVPNLQEQLSHHTGSTGCLTQTQLLRSREERAHSEPPEIKSANIVPTFKENISPISSANVIGKDCVTSVDPISGLSASTSSGNVTELNAEMNCTTDDKAALETSVGSVVDPTVSLGSVVLDGSTTLSQTSESSSGVTGELTSTESPRKDSDPENCGDLGLPEVGASSGPGVSEAVALGADSASAPHEGDVEGSVSSPAPGDGASSTGSEGRRAATAFTIELDKEDDGEGSVKKLDITGPLSKWAPKHRRNLSLTKVEENKKVEERAGKPPVYRARSGTIGGSSSPAGGLGGPRKPGGYHSEGYFSSDQDEDAPRKTDMRSPRSPRTPDAKSPIVGAAGLANGVTRSASQDFHRVSPTLRKSSVASRPGDSTRACCKGLEKKPSVADITGRSSRSSSDKGSKASTKIETRKADAGSTHTNCQPFKVDRLADDNQRDEDEVSEAGTYTIDKDSSPEMDRGRGDIERGFGLAGADNAQYSPADPQPTSWDNSPGADTFKTSPSISRNSPNWIQQWAAQVAEQTSVGDLSDLTPSKGDKIPSPRGSKLSMLSSVAGSQDSSDMLRPRRKLPMPPGLLQQSYPSGSAREMAEIEALAKTRARVTDNTPITSSGGYRIASFESHDSGGDSDLDTSTSYVMQEPPPPLRAKLKLSGLNGTPLKATLSPRSKLESSSKRDRSNLSEGGLRRARLVSEDTLSGPVRQPPMTPTERRKQQPVMRSSSSSVISSRRSTTNRTGPILSDNTRSPPAAPMHQAVVKSPSRSSIKKEPSGLQRKHSNSRSNSTMSSKEVDFQNWKRRKNYDPMKAAKDGRKKHPENRGPEKSTSDNVTSSDRGSPSPPGSLLRSASFHGSEGIMGGVGGRWPRPPMGRYHNPYTSEEDGPVSYDEETPLPPAPHASPLRRSPTSPHQLHQSPLASSVLNRRASYTQSDDSEPIANSPSRKISMDDTGSEGKRSPLSIGGGGASSTTSAAGGSRGPNINTNNNNGRSRAKIEALDNLVISTIHSLSTKVRGTSENLLQKLKTQYGSEDRDRADLLQNVLNHLNSESESASSQIRSTSRDLSGILKNLKKIQTALEVIDQVMVVGGGEYDDLEDLGWPQNNTGSDY